MKILIPFLLWVWMLTGCSQKNPPLTDISNAKMALVKVDNSPAKRYAPKLFTTIQKKYQKLQLLMKQKEYEKAQFLAQEIQADARLLEKRSQRVMLEKDAKKVEGEINLITKDFAEIRE